MARRAPTAADSAVLICNGPSAEGYAAPAGSYAVCLNAGFQNHRKADGSPVDAAYTTDCPFSIQQVWTDFPGWRVQSLHIANLRKFEELHDCQELNARYHSSAFACLGWLRAKGVRKALVAGMDALYGAGHAGLDQKMHIQGCLAFAKLFPDGLTVRDLDGCEHPVTDEYLASIPVGLTVQTHGPRGKESVTTDPAPAPPPLFVGFYTENTPYEDEAKLLRVSLENFGLDYHLRGVPNLGSWQKNTQYKAKFIRQMQVKFGRPLIYIDVDAIVVERPALLLKMRAAVDLAACHFCMPKVAGGELLSGTVYFGKTPACEQVVQRWIEINSKYPDVLPDGRPAWDQRTLEMAISCIPGVKFQELPPEYTFITGITSRELPDLKPVILHTRGAYRFKAQINAGGAPRVYKHWPWVVWPSAEPARAERQAAKWRDMNYNVGILVDGDAEVPGADFVLHQAQWSGFPAAANALCLEAIKREAKVVVVAGDDIDPDPQTPGPEIAARFLKLYRDTEFVAQPTGDAFGAFDKCCISPWIGRAFIEKTYGGRGPYWGGYQHCYCDQELQEVAQKMERFFQAPDLCQRHNHWTRIGRKPSPHHDRIMHAREEDERLFNNRKAAGFPGHQGAT